MSWSHRVVRTVLPPDLSVSADERVRHHIAEVYFGDNEAQPEGWGDAGEVDHFGADGDDWKGELEQTIERYRRALDRPVMDFGADGALPAVKVPAEDWAAYRAENEALKALNAELAAALRRLVDIAEAEATWAWSPIRQSASAQARAVFARTPAQAAERLAQLERLYRALLAVKEARDEAVLVANCGLSYASFKAAMDRGATLSGEVDAILALLTEAPAEMKAGGTEDAH